MRSDVKKDAQVCLLVFPLKSDSENKAENAGGQTPTTAELLTLRKYAGTVTPNSIRSRLGFRDDHRFRILAISRARAAIPSSALGASACPDDMLPGLLLSRCYIHSV